MPVTRAKKHEIVDRRTQVSQLYLRGWTQMAIARELGVGQPTISNDLAALHKDWRRSALRDFDALREAQLQKLDHLEREAWAAYDRSVGTKQRRRMVARDGVKVNEVEQWESHGDANFLRVVSECINKRCELLDIKAPMRVSINSRSVRDMTEEELDAIIMGHFDGPLPLLPAAEPNATLVEAAPMADGK